MAFIPFPEMCRQCGPWEWIGSRYFNVFYVGWVNRTPLPDVAASEGQTRANERVQTVTAAQPYLPLQIRDLPDVSESVTSRDRTERPPVSIEIETWPAWTPLERDRASKRACFAWQPAFERQFRLGKNNAQKLST